MKNLMLFVIVLISVPVLAGDVVSLDPAARARAGIDVQTVAEQQFGNSIRVVGQVVRTPGSTATVQSVLHGKVEELFVGPGDRVSAGSVVLSLHSHELLTMQGALLRASEGAKIAANQVVAGRKLLELEGISELEFTRRRQEALVAQLDLEAALAELSDVGYHDDDIEALLESRKTDAHLLVTSPVDGVVLELSVQEHQWVQSFESMIVVGDPRRIELELQVAPDHAHSISVGDQLVFGSVGHAGGGGKAMVITQVPQVDPTTRTIRLRAEILERPGALYPGVFVEGRLSHGANRRAPAVPESAVIRLAAEDVVFVQQQPGSYEVRPVTLGQFEAGLYELVDGVEVGENVVVAGVFFLKSAHATGEGEEE